jgi:hypothetical protein
MNVRTVDDCDDYFKTTRGKPDIFIQRLYNTVPLFTIRHSFALMIIMAQRRPHVRTRTRESGANIRPSRLVAHCGWRGLAAETACYGLAYTIIEAWRDIDLPTD